MLIITFSSHTEKKALPKSEEASKLEALKPCRKLKRPGCAIVFIR